MNVQQDKIHVIQMQHAQIMLVHTHVNAIVDLWKRNCVHGYR